jgi:hypothetical protein
MSTPTGPVTLAGEQAEDLLHVLGRVEDWLRHADPDTRTDLAAFLNAPGNGALAAAGLIDALGRHTAILHQRLAAGGSRDE